jgi:uncharacterized GH25 family protein
VLWVALARGATAHDTWILPAATSARVGQAVVVDATSGMAFPALDYAMPPARIARASVRLGGVETQILERRRTAHSLRFSVPVPSAGTATIWVETRPKTLELAPDQVREYLAEIGAAPEIAKAWEESPSKRWRETYTKHAKTFVRSGEGSSDRSWAESAGMKLEIVPENDPFAVAAGAEFSVRVLFDGKPLSGFPVGFLAGGEKEGTIRKTDADGRASFTLGRAGWWLVRGTRLEPSSRSDADWLSHFTTVTLRVAPAR